jgi:YfiH family protein
LNSYQFIQKDCGSGFSNGEYLVFFGNKNLSFADLKSEFSDTELTDLDFCKIRQTHSDILIDADSASTTADTEADAHYSGEPRKALLIATADCIPLMISCHRTRRVAAVHAGWRGVANQISYKTLRYLLQSGSTPESLNFFIGPHIRKTSFEVRNDALGLLQAAQFGLADADYFTGKDGLYLVDLEKIILSQLTSLLNTAPNFFKIAADTKTNADYFSYRRDQTKLRNLSFIVRR